MKFFGWVFCFTFFISSISLAETYSLRLAGNSFSSVEENDNYTLNDTGYQNGIKINANLYSGSPTVYYKFELPPLTSGTYGSITLRFKGNGRTNIFVGQQAENFGGSSQIDGVVSFNLNSSYLESKVGYAEFQIGFKSYSNYRFSLDYIELDFSINTQNQWLHYFIREREAARVIDSLADVVASFGNGYSGLNSEPYFTDIIGNINRPGFIFETLAISHISEFSQIAGIAFDCIGILEDIDMLARSIRGGINFLNMQTLYSSGFNTSFGKTEWPLKTSENIRLHADYLRTLANRWIEFGQDGELSQYEISQLESQLQIARNRLTMRPYSTMGSVRCNLDAFMEGWKRVNNSICADNPDIFNNWVKPAVYGIRGGLWYECGNPGATISGPNIAKSFIYAYESSLAATELPMGSLSVIINPSSGRWRLYGNGQNFDWKSSGSTVSNIPVGSYTLEFSSVSGYITPTPMTIAINKGANTRNITYNQQGSQTVTLIANEYAFLSSDTPNAAGIRSTRLWIFALQNPYANYMALVRYNINSIPDGSIITSAKFMLKSDRADYDYARMYAVSSDWSQYSVTYNTLPKVLSLDYILNGTSGIGWWEWQHSDLTYAVQHWVDHNNYGIMINPHFYTVNNEMIHFYSPSHDVAVENRPKVVVTYIPPKEYLLYLGKSGNGRVKVNGSFRNLPNQQYFKEGTQITLEAVPDSCWQFSGWAGSITSSTNPTTITMNSNKDITANFTQPTYSLSIAKSGNGRVRVNGVERYLPWSGNFTACSTVTIEAVPDANWLFEKWTGSITGTESTKTVTIDSNKNITANFIQSNYELSIDKKGNGYVYLNGTLLDLPWADSLPTFSTITLEAVPDTNWQFEKWMGAISGSNTTTIITMNGNKSITANFKSIFPSKPSDIYYPSHSSTGRYVVSWTTSDNATSYQLERSDNGGETWLRIYSYSNNFLVENLDDGSYLYRVRATNDKGSSDWQMGNHECLVIILPDDPNSGDYGTIINGDFELSEPNDFGATPIGWNTDNYALVHREFTPCFERRQTCYWSFEDNSVSTQGGNAFLVLSTGDYGYDACSGDSLSHMTNKGVAWQECRFKEGQSIFGRYFFGTGDYVGWNDFATIKLIPSDPNNQPHLEEITLVYIDVVTVGDFSSTDKWLNFCHTFTIEEQGDYLIQFAVYDGKDHIYKSYLMIDVIACGYLPPSGDFNNDGKVNILDLPPILSAMYQNCSDPNALSSSCYYTNIQNQKIPFYMNLLTGEDYRNEHGIVTMDVIRPLLDNWLWEP